MSQLEIKDIDDMSSKCQQCASLQNVSHPIVEQSTRDPPEAVGDTVAADIVKRV